MTRLTRLAVLRPRAALLAFVLLILVAAGLAGTAGGSYDDSFSLPDTESSRAQEVLEAEFPQSAGATATLVVGDYTEVQADPAASDRLDQLLADLQAVPDVAAVVGPSSPDAQQQGLVSPDGGLAQARIAFGGELTDVDPASVREVVELTEAADEQDGLTLGLSGQVLDSVQEPPTSEVVGVAVAIVVLLLLFGAAVAAALPILSALLGLVVGLSLVTVAANVLTVATFAPTLAVMIGLGVGIDYGLFVVDRFRAALRRGATPTDAALETAGTAGRAVVFAATTVVIALGGLLVLGISFLNGLAFAAGVTVVAVMLSSVVLLPAALRLLGHRVLAGKVPGAERRAAKEGSAFGRYGEALQERPVVAVVVALALLGLLVAPLTGLRIGFPDDSTQAEGSLQRTAYDLTSEAFGPGSNGPFLVAVELGQPGDLAPVQALAGALREDPGVAVVSPPQPAPSGQAALLTVQPTTGPQAAETGETLDRLRADVIPSALDGTAADAYVGGATAISADFGAVLTDALPLFLVVVIGLGFLVLVVLFRSLLVPAVGALSSLLSLGAALGVCVAVFQYGWLSSVFGVSGEGPVLPFIPIMVFAILFGLAMDYQVFLASRMQEEFAARGDARAAVRAGLRGSGRVVAAAAIILSSVFLAFVFEDDRIIKTFGLTLGVGVLVDAFVVRLVLVPAVLTLLGPSAWWLPGPLRRVLPTLEIESSAPAGQGETVPRHAADGGDRSPAGMA